MAANFFGQWLLERGLISPDALIDAVEYQKKHNASLGEIAIEQNLLSEAQVQTINAEQQRTDKKFGEIAVGQNLINAEQLDELLAAQKSRRIFFGEALLALGHIDKQKLDSEIAAHKKAQEEHEELLKADLENIPESETIKAMLDHTLKLFLRIARQMVKIKNVSTKPVKISGAQHSFAQEITGDKPFYFVLTMPDALITVIAGKLLMDESEQEINELTLDAAAEFVNIIVGHGCGKLCTLDYAVHANPPFGYQKSETKDPDHKELVCVELTSTQGDLLIEFLLR